MSVFTSPCEIELGEYLLSTGLGKLQKLQGIQAGIENSNFFLTTDSQQYVLTIFESLRTDELTPFIKLQRELAEQGIPVPTAVASQTEQAIFQLANKPAVIFTRLQGQSITEADETQCHALGQMLAKLHTLGSGRELAATNYKDHRWFKTQADAVANNIAEPSQALLAEEIRFQSLFNRKNLPQSFTHADLFRDNVLFEGNIISGVLDFYAACEDASLFDLAICANDWCSREDGSLHAEKCLALLQGYREQRKLTQMEKGAWPIMLRLAALRFWLSRLADQLAPRSGKLTHTKDPQPYENILRHRIAEQNRNRRMIS